MTKPAEDPKQAIPSPEDRVRAEVDAVIELLNFAQHLCEKPTLPTDQQMQHSNCELTEEEQIHAEDVRAQAITEVHANSMTSASNYTPNSGRATPASTARTDGWVSLNDRLPEPSDDVYYEMLHGTDDRSFAYYDPAGAKKEGNNPDWCWFDREENAWCHKARYTHWKLITAAPGSVPQAPDNHSDLFFGNLQYSLQTLFAKVGDPFKDLAEWGAVWEALESARKHFGVPQAEPPK